MEKGDSNKNTKFFCEFKNDYSQMFLQLNDSNYKTDV